MTEKNISWNLYKCLQDYIANWFFYNHKKQLMILWRHFHTYDFIPIFKGAFSCAVIQSNLKGDEGQPREFAIDLISFIMHISLG